ncbi:MAG: AAA family ATPase, partial [Evtepia sp.]
MPTKDNAVTGYAQQILTQVRKAVVGKDQVLLWVLSAILARGHILLEDIPGVGKTTMALAF